MMKFARSLKRQAKINKEAKIYFENPKNLKFYK